MNISLYYQILILDLHYTEKQDKWWGCKKFFFNDILRKLRQCFVINYRDLHALSSIPLFYRLRN